MAGPHTQKPPAWVVPVTWGLLIFFIVTAWLQWSWPSGLFFLWLAGRGVLDRQTFLVTPLERAKTPVTYWAVVAMWAFFGLLSVLADAWPALLQG